MDTTRGLQHEGNVTDGDKKRCPGLQRSTPPVYPPRLPAIPHSFSMLRNTPFSFYSIAVFESAAVTAPRTAELPLIILAGDGGDTLLPDFSMRWDGSLGIPGNQKHVAHSAGATLPKKCCETRFFFISV